MSSSSENLIYLTLGSAVSKLIEAGEVPLEDVQDAQEYYDTFVKELEAEWPAQRICEWLLNREREKYKFYRKTLAEKETENKEARIKGMSYAARQKFSRQIIALEGLMKDSEKKGAGYAQSLKTKNCGQYRALNYVSPLVVDLIHLKGFEHHLKYATI